MGKTQNTGRLTNGIFQDSSNNIAIGDSTASGFKFKVTGTSNLNGALSGTSATFSTRIDIGTRSGGNIRNLNIYGATNGNAIIKLDSTDGNGYGSQIDYISKTGGGTTNTWTVGTGVTAGNNEFEFFNGASTIFKLAQNGAATFSSSVTATQINASANFYASSAAPTLVLTNAAQSTTFGYLQHNGTDLSLFNSINGATIFATNNTERMRIGSTASQWDLMVGCTSVLHPSANRGSISINGTSNSIYSLGVGGSAKGYLYHGGTQMYLENSVGSITVIAGGSNGVLLSSGATSWTSASDERLKNINSEIENALEKIMTLRAVNFSWKSDKTNKENLGFIAQEVEKVFPQVIDKNKLFKGVNDDNEDKTEYLGVRYQELTPVNTKAIQELYQLVLLQDAKIEELKALIAAK